MIKQCLVFAVKKGFFPFVKSQEITCAQVASIVLAAESRVVVGLAMFSTFATKKDIDRHVKTSLSKLPEHEVGQKSGWDRKRAFPAMGTAPGGGPDRSFLDFFAFGDASFACSFTRQGGAPSKNRWLFHYFDSFEVRFGCRGRLMGEW